MPEDSRSGDAVGGLLMAGRNLRAFFMGGEYADTTDPDEEEVGAATPTTASAPGEAQGGLSSGKGRF